MAEKEEVRPKFTVLDGIKKSAEHAAMVPRKRGRKPMTEAEKAKAAAERALLPKGATEIPKKAPDARTAAKFIRYVDSAKETWMVDTRKSLENTNKTLAQELNKLGYDKVRDYVNSVEEIADFAGWRKHLVDRYNEATVRYFEEFLKNPEV